MNSKTAFRSIGSFLLQIPLWLYFIVSVYPLFWMISYSLKNNDEIFVTNPFGFPTHFRFENYVNAWTQFNIPRYFMNSFIVSIISTLFILLLALMFASCGSPDAVEIPLGGQNVYDCRDVHAAAGNYDTFGHSGA